MKSNKDLYWILAILSMAGYAWIGFQWFSKPVHENGFTPCLFKNITGVSCPSCGVTRALMVLITGDMEKALMINPLGFIVAIALLILPAWIITDIVTRKNTLAKSFLWTEQKLKTQKAISMPLAALVLLNWGWNILKDL